MDKEYDSVDDEYIEDNSNSSDEEGNSKDWRWKEATFINCDLRYYDLSTLGGNFDAVLIDPPWFTCSAIYSNLFVGESGEFGFIAQIVKILIYVNNYYALLT